MFSQLQMGLGAVAGAVIGISLTLSWVTVFHDPAVKAEHGKVVEAKCRENFEGAVEELTDEATRFRVARAVCLRDGGVFSHATGECRRQ